MSNKQTERQTDFALKPGMHLHLLGIGGSGMSAIAWVLLDRGFTVSGSDLQATATTEGLENAGATIYQGHDAAYITGAEALIISSAIPGDNPEVAAAREKGIAVLKRAGFLGELMTEQIGLAVAGTHGKTTTTSMITHLLEDNGHDPSVIVGGILPESGRNGRAGKGELFVIEADEYDYMFLGLRPQIEVITNIEHDHPDMFPTADDYQEAFRQFVQLLPANGTLIACRDDDGVRQLLGSNSLAKEMVLTYGLSKAESGFTAVDVRPNQLGGSDFVVLLDGETLGLARLRLPGVHNVRNALAAIAACHTVGIPFAEMHQGLASFGGVGRRFQVTGEVADVTVIDDYAHHPTEIQVTLAAARQRYPGRRLWAVWQPHTFSRTRLYLDAFASSFTDADRVIVLDIYRSREQDDLGIDSKQVVARMDHPYARHAGSRENAAAYVLDRVHPGDVILTLGAGDGDRVGQWILDGLQERVR